MIGVIVVSVLVVLVLSFGATTVKYYKAYEEAQEELNQQEHKNKMLQQENSMLHDEVANLSYQLMREDSSNVAKQN